MGVIFDGVPYDEYEETYRGYFDLTALKKIHGDKDPGFRMKYARYHPVTFAWFLLGKRLRIYQAYAIDKILNNQRVALCWARRLGKSTIVSIIALWMTYFNLKPKNNIEKYTVIGIISKEDKAAKKLLLSIRELMYDGDLNMKQKGFAENYFTRHLIEPNNTEQLTFSNRSRILSFPPTKKVRGEGFSTLFIDEIAFLAPPNDNADDYYFGVALPTVGDTNGNVCISSTPNGRGNLFFKLFDPEGEHDTEFIGIKFTHDIVNNEVDTTYSSHDQCTDIINYSTYVSSNRKMMYAQGKGNLFRQEFMADFTVTQSSFFAMEDVNNYFDPKLSPRYEWLKGECSMGIDYGISQCHTVITIKTKFRGKLITLYQRTFPLGYDINELMNPNNEDSIPRLNKRYNICWIVPDDCAQGDMLNKLLIREGYPCTPYSFSNTGTKNKAYYTYKAKLLEGNMKSYPIDALKQEMTILQEEILKKYVSISKPSGGTDDRIDSDVFATMPFFDNDDSDFGTIDVEELQEQGEYMERGRDGRVIDHMWESLKSTYNNIMR